MTIPDDLAAWHAYGQALISALPPVDEGAEAMVTRALARRTAHQPARRLSRRQEKP